MQKELPARAQLSRHSFFQLPVNTGPHSLHEMVEVLDVSELDILVLDVLELDVDMPDSEVLEMLVLLEDVLVLLVEVLDVEVTEIPALGVLELDVDAERGSTGGSGGC